jgi:hypothetical protein
VYFACRIEFFYTLFFVWVDLLSTPLLVSLFYFFGGDNRIRTQRIAVAVKRATN